MSDTASLDVAWARADQAKIRQITAAHRRAITLQEDAAARFDQLGLFVYAATARGRAVRARGLLQIALDEQAETAPTVLACGPTRDSQQSTCLTAVQDLRAGTSRNWQRFAR